MSLFNFLFNPALLASTLLLMTPILFACLAGLFSERSGIVDIGLEGKLLVAAFASASFAYVSGNAWLGALMGVFVSICFSMLHGFASITLRGNQLISGVAINFLASGLTAFLGNAWFKQGGNTPALSGAARFQKIELPFAEQIGHIPFLGPFYERVLSGQVIWVYVALACVPLTAWIVYRTRFGLRLLAVGENPAAVDTAGISVSRMRYLALIIAGILVGLGGVYLSNGILAGFGREMSAGRGYMALAALIFAKWKPWNALLSCLLFGYLQAFSIRYSTFEFPLLFSISFVAVIGAILIVLVGWKDFRKSLISAVIFLVAVLGATLLIFTITGVDFGITTKLPSQLMDALPYILTMIVLAGFVGKAIAPRAVGVPYSKEH